MPARHEPWRSAAVGGIRALAIILLGGLALRLALSPPTAWQPDGGSDEQFWKQWMEAISQHGVLDVFSTSNANYTGYLWVLAGLSHVFGWTGRSYSESDPILHLLVRVPPIMFDLALIGAAYLAVFAVARAMGDDGLDSPSPKRTQRLALVAALIVAVHPAVVYDSAVWAQTDSAISVAMLGAIILCARGCVGWGATVWALGFLIKPEAIVVAPLLAVIVARRRSWQDASVAAICVAGAAAVVLGPWFLHGAGGDVIRVYRWNFKEHLPQLSPSAWNVWWLHDAIAGHSAPDDSVGSGLPVTYRQIGSVLGVTAALFSLWYASVRPTLAGALTAGAYVVFAFYVLPVGVRERYGFPALILLVPLVVLGDRPRLLLWLAMSGTMFLNMISRAPPVYALHGLGLIESPLGIAISMVNVLLLVAFSVLLFLEGRQALVSRQGQDAESTPAALPQPVAALH